MKTNTITATIEIKIPFFDVDAMQITWHGNYIKYFEMARCALLDKLKFNYQAMAASDYQWPVVDLRVKYVRPTFFNQDVVITATLVEYENRLKIEYLVQDKETLEKLTKGYSVQVAVNKVTNELCFVSPDVLVTKVEGYMS